MLIDDVDVRLGGERARARCQYERVKVSRGTMFAIIGDKAFADGKEWWRIEPPPTEVRYVAKGVADAADFDRRGVIAGGTGGPPRAGPAIDEPQMGSRPSWP